MAILKVARMGHPVLRANARTVEPAEIVSAEFQRLIDDMFDTMYDAHGIGLAAILLRDRQYEQAQSYLTAAAQIYPRGEWTAVYTVLFVTVSWLQIEAKEGAL